MPVKTDRLFSLRRLFLLVLAAALTSFALSPAAGACNCAHEGDTQIIYDSPECCSPPIIGRPGEYEVCQSCQWVTTSSGCFSAPSCAE
jgi:hypothetical protein